MPRSLTLRLSDHALQVAPLEGLVRLARALGLDATQRSDESDGAYRRRLRHAVQRAEAAGVAGRRWLLEDAG